MSRKNILIALGGRPRRRRPSSARTSTSSATRGSPSRPRRSRRATSRRSSRRPARFSRSGSSTSAPTRSGRVVNLAVNEGDRGQEGPVPAADRPRSRCARASTAATASLQAAEVSLEQMRQSVETGARAARAGAAEPEAPAGSLEPAADHARSARQGRERRAAPPSRRCQEREKRPTPQASRIAQERADLESARYDLSKVRIESPIDGIVTRRNIQEGETAIIGTMNNAGTVLLTLADMSVIQAEVEVDETNIPNVQLGQQAKITIDAIPDQIVHGPRHRDRQQPDSDDGRRRDRHAGDQLQGGGRCSTSRCPTCGPASPARPTSRRRRARTSSRCRFRPSPCASSIVRRERPDREARRDRQASGAPRRRRPAGAAPSCKPGQTRKETEGVFVVRDGTRGVRARSRWASPATSTSRCCRACKAGDQVITGPYNSVRGMADGDLGRRSTTRSRSSDSEQVLRIRADRARRDLGGQAAVVHDRARQHRRGHVDHRRRVAHPGAERLGQGGDPQPGRRRLVQHPAVPDHAQRRGVRAGPQQPAHHARRRARDPRATADAHRGGDGRGRAAAAGITYRDKSIDSTQHPRRDRGVRQLLDASTPSAAG